MIKKYKLDEFEFSQSYLFWCDKFEKSNYFLESILSTLKEPTDSRLVQFLLTSPVQDGGQWDMLINLIEKVNTINLMNVECISHPYFIVRRYA